MSKGIAPKIKRTTLTKDAKICKSKQTSTGFKKDMKQKERQQVWNQRIQNAVKENQKKNQESKAQPLSYFDAVNEQLDSIETTTSKAPIRPDLVNPHLKRVVSNKGRKQVLKKEQDQFLKVMSHPAYKSNPLGAIGLHLSNTINQIHSLPKKN